MTKGQDEHPLPAYIQLGKSCCRVGRAAFAKQLKLEAVELAVLAHIRHTETE